MLEKIMFEEACDFSPQTADSTNCKDEPLKF